MLGRENDSFMRTRIKTITVTHLVVIWLAGVMLVAPNAFAQQLDETCTVTVNGQTVQVNPDGTFVIPNVSAVDRAPVDFLSDDLLRVRGICIRDGETVFVVSDCFRMVPGGTIDIQNLQFTTIPQLTISSITVSAGITTMTKLGEQTQLVVDGILSDGTSTIIDGTNSCAITYRTTNSDIVAIDETGTATAMGSGFALLSASTEGLTAVMLQAVSLGDPLTTVTGLVHMPDGSGVVGADIELLGFERFTQTLGNGSFLLTDVPTELGDIHAIAIATIGGEEFYGAGRFVEAVGGGFSDAGIIKLSNAIRWVKPADGVWSNVENWEIFSPPGKGQNAVIDIPDVEITVTHDDTVGFNGPIGDLLCNERLRLGFFNSLSVAGTFQMNNILEMEFGELVDSTVDLGPGGLINVLRIATLDGVTINGNMDLVVGNFPLAIILNGLTLNGNIRMSGLNTTAGSRLRFEGPGQFLDGNATISFVSGGLGLGAAVVQNDSGTLHIRSGVTIRGTGGFVGHVNAPLVLDGLIHSDLTGPINVWGGPWVNNGTLRATGDSSVLILRGSGTNHGTIEAADGGRLILDGTYQNLGTLTATDADVRLDGDFTIADLGTYDFGNSLVSIEGTLHNEAGLVLDANQFNWKLGNGVILGGTISSADGTTLEQIPGTGGGRAALDGVTLNTDLRIDRFFVQIHNGLTLNGTIRIARSRMLSPAGLRIFTPIQTINGTGRIEFLTIGPNTVWPGRLNGTGDLGVLTIGSGITIVGARGCIGSDGNIFASSLINDGTIHSDRLGRITIAGTDWINNGLLQSSGDGDLFTFDSWTNNGVLRLGPGPLFDSRADFTQSSTGTFVVDVRSTAAEGNGLLLLTGTATLDGVLRLEFEDAFDPAAGQSFVVLEYGSRSGEFASIEAVGLDPSLQIVPSYEESFLELVIQQQ